MNLDVITELENKVEKLIQLVLKAKDDLDLKEKRIQEMESENINLLKELDACKQSSLEKQDQLNAAAEKVKGLLTKLEKVEELA